MFQKAIPVYPKNQSETLNTFTTFPLETGSLEGAELHITAASFYQLWVNGEFVAFGPARTAKGYAREDVISLDRFRGERNHVQILVAGYFCKSFNGVKQKSFLQAELRKGDEILYATSLETKAYRNGRKLQKTPRYAGQRQFAEHWDLSASALEELLPVEEIEHPVILDRVVPYPTYERIGLSEIASRGTLKLREDADPSKRNYSGRSGRLAEGWGEFKEEEILAFPYTWIRQYEQIKTEGTSSLPVTLREGEYAILDFGRIECGFFDLKVSCSEESDLVLGYSEGGSGDKFEYTTMHALNAMEFHLPAEERHATAFEPYTARYILVAAKKGTITVSQFGIIPYEADTSAVSLPDTGDETLNAIARGAVRTYAHNAVDLYTDCPSRERAGWLCDSYFTAKTEYFLFGKVPVEKAFLENFRLYRNEELPEGALPMCYPADIEVGAKFIPQWTMWYLLEVAEYLLQRAPEEDKEAFRPSVDGLLKFYQRYENNDGLLEKLPSWNFVEWSAANSWTQDVNYPTNFLYAEVLRRMADLYGDASLKEKAAKIAKTAREQSFNGSLFLDHAIRNEEGALVRQEHCSEVCQYYAILFGDVDLNDEIYAELRNLVYNVFGAERKQELPDIEPINAFIGVYLRMEALLKLEKYDLLISDIREFFGAMEQETGTLWEYRQGTGSRDHGFASYALVAMYKALRGGKE
ncbi:MAG: hypothetical protein J6M34_07365 [Clostridia bacterium]|nr:hypothetical protein [Clostridia bacterium]